MCDQDLGGGPSVEEVTQETFNAGGSNACSGGENHANEIGIRGTDPDGPSGGVRHTSGARDQDLYAHDILHPSHERDFRSLAVFPIEDLHNVKVVVLRADYRGRLVVESITGASWAPGGCLLWALIWKGHMVYVQPPENLDTDGWLAAEEVFFHSELGFPVLLACTP